MHGEADVGVGVGDSQGSDIVVATVIVFLAVGHEAFRRFSYLCPAMINLGRWFSSIEHLSAGIIPTTKYLLNAE